MRSFKRFLAASLVLVLTGVLLQSCGSKNNPTSPKSAGGGSSTPVLYIYNSDSTTASSYQSFLNSHGYNVTLVTVGNAINANFSQYSAIIIGWDTASTSPWGGSISDLPVSIVDSGKPVLGIGAGGSYYFEAAGITTLSAAHTGGFTGVTVVSAQATSSAFWTTPNSVSTSAPVTLDTNTTLSVIELYYTASPGAGTTFLGVDPNHTDYYPLAVALNPNSMDFFWGLTDSPSSMTSAGQNLFLNVLSNLISLNPSLLISYPNIGDGGSPISDGLDITAYPGTTLTGIVLWVSSNTSGSYTFNLVANDSCFNGTPIATSTTSTTTLSGSTTSFVPVIFSFNNAVVTKGDAVAMFLAENTGPSATCYFSITGDYGSLTGSSILVDDLFSTTPDPCLNTINNDGYAVVVYGHN